MTNGIMRRLVTVLLMVAVAVSGTAEQRKKVAVVLSGGGAKGMAHIGALRVIERAGLPIDIVTGTSMGSLVGGLYAIGYNADALDSLVRQQDWTYVITDKENMSAQSLADRKKQNTYALQRGLTIGKRNATDGGIITGKNLAVLFQKLCVGYTDSLDFSKDLPIPFACVATDIVDNTEHDFHSGLLPQAMRSSMAIPAVFSPVRIGNMVLVDGGLQNNYPADLAREMGADIIIGVTVQGPLKTASELGSTMAILSQIIDVNCMNKYNDNLAITDVPIRVDVTGYSAASFTQAAVDTLIRRGEEEAMRHWDELIALKECIGIDENFKPRRLKPFRPQAMTERVKVTAFEFENTTAQDERFIRNKFRLERVDSADTGLEERIATSMRTDLFFQSVDTRSVPDGDGYRIVFTAGNRKTTQVNVGFRFDTEEVVALRLNADVPLSIKHPVNVDMTVRLGKRMMGRGELTFHPSSFTRPVLAYTFRHNDVDVYYEGDRDYSVRYNHHQAEFVPVNFSVRNFNVKMGIRWDYYHYGSKLLADESREMAMDNAHYFSYRAQVDFNSEDSWYFPTRGARFNAAYAYLTDNFSQLDGKAGMSDVSASWRKSVDCGGGFCIQPMLYGRLLFGANRPSIFGNVVGGDWFGHYVEQQMPFAGLGNVEFVSDHFVAAQIQAQQRIGSNHYIVVKFTGAQHADKPGRLLDYHTLLGSQASYYYNTMFGPLGASIGYSNRAKKPYVYVNLGYEF